VKQGRIYVDDRGYQGESLDQDEPRQPGLVNGFQSNNFDRVSALQFGDEAIVIQAEINIKSALDRIFARIRNKTLSATRIVIELEDME